jgi:transposase
MRTAQPITLSDDDRASLHTCVHRGHAAARSQTRAHMLLKLAAGWRDTEVAQAFDVHVATVGNTRRRFQRGGVDEVLHDRQQERHRQALTGGQIAHLIAIACSPAPHGHDHWTLRLLAGKAVELGYVPGISPETVRHALKKTSSNLGSMSNGVSPVSARRSSQRWKRSSTSTQPRPSRRSR